MELLYSFERYFSLDVPDPVAEKLYTVGDAAAYFSQRLGVARLRQSAAREAVARQLGELLGLPVGAFDESGPTTVARFQQVVSSCGLSPPELSGSRRQAAAGPSFFEKLLGITPAPPPVPWPAHPLGALVDWKVATNYEQLLPNPPTSEYEVERALVGITSDKSGVPIEEIQLSSSFTDELGMD